MSPNTMNREEIILLCETHYATHSASQIARMIGNGMTRSAVAGIWHRRGLKDKEKASPSSPSPVGSQPKSRTSTRPAARPTSSRTDFKKSSLPVAAKTAAAPIATTSPQSENPTVVEAPVSTPPSPSQSKTNQPHMDLMRRPADACSYPVGRNSAGNTVFCCQPQMGGKPYCKEHHQIMYQPRQSNPVKGKPPPHAKPQHQVVHT